MVKEEEIAHAVHAHAHLISLPAFEIGAQLERAQESEICEFVQEDISAAIDGEYEVEGEIGADKDNLVAVSI